MRAVAVTFAFAADGADLTRLLDHELAGGGILDVGCYCVSMAQLIAGGGRAGRRGGRPQSSIRPNGSTATARAC